VTGIEDIQNTHFDLFPNPTKGIVNINISEMMKDSKIQMVDVLGQVVFRTRISIAGNHQLDLNHLSSGQYIIIMSNENYSATKLLVLE